MIVEPHLFREAIEAPSAFIELATTSERAPDSSRFAAGEMQKYFRSWLEHWPDLRVVIGGFLALLGGDPAMKKLAQEYLGKDHTVAIVRERLRPCKRIPLKGRMPRSIRSGFRCGSRQASWSPVNNLLGEQISAAAVMRS